MFRRKKPAFPPERGPRRRDRRRRNPWLYFFALIGMAAVLFLLIRFLIVPLLVVIR